MTDAKVKEVCRFYLERLTHLEEYPGRWSHAGKLHPQLKHARRMLPEIEGFIDMERREKAMRWLGFVQGTLCCHGIYSIDEMKEHNRARPGEEMP